MNKLLAAFAFMISHFFLFTTMASEISVHDLNQGSCWVYEGDQVKVADFNSSKAYVIEQSMVQSLVSLYSDGKRPESLDSMVHCSSNGVAIVMNFRIGLNRFCLWGRPYQNQLELISYGRSLNESGPCDGVSLAKVSLKRYEHVDNLMVQSFLESKISDGKILDYSINDKWFSVSGTSAFEFKEEFLKDELMKSGLFESYEFDHLRHHQGEFLRLNNLSL